MQPVSSHKKHEKKDKTLLPDTNACKTIERASLPTRLASGATQKSPHRAVRVTMRGRSEDAFFSNNPKKKLPFLTFRLKLNYFWLDLYHLFSWGVWSHTGHINLTVVFNQVIKSNQKKKKKNSIDYKHNSIKNRDKTWSVHCTLTSKTQKAI